MQNFRSKSFLQNHIQSILEFYLPTLIDPNGGYHQNFYDDGSIFEPGRKHLVSSCRMVINLCLAQRIRGDQKYESLWRSGLDFVRKVHKKQDEPGYHWIVNEREVVDGTNHAYGLAFVLLMYANTYQNGDEGSRKNLYEVWDLLEENFWIESDSIYLDEISADWSIASEYRGQNANMHACEALIAAYEATGDQMFLDRAFLLANRFTLDLADTKTGLIWEHYTPHLEQDLEYNRDDPKNLYRPWGFQPGHQTEWTKLLLQIHTHKPEDWLIQKAAHLFDKALEIAWDQKSGGIFYGFAPDFSICDDEKYFWVQAESFAAAALLEMKTGQRKYQDWYEKIWEYCWAYFVDHRYGGWFRILSPGNEKITDIKSEAGAKIDYHTIGACSLVYHLL